MTHPILKLFISKPTFPKKKKCFTFPPPPPLFLWFSSPVQIAAAHLSARLDNEDQMHAIFKFEGKIVDLLNRQSKPFSGLCTAVSWVFSHEKKPTRFVRCIEWSECGGLITRVFKSTSLIPVVVEHALTEDDFKHCTEQTQTVPRHDDGSKAVKAWTDLRKDLSSLSGNGFKSFLVVVERNGVNVTVHSAGMNEQTIRTETISASRAKIRERLYLGNLLSVSRDSPELALGDQVTLFNCLPGLAHSIQRLDEATIFTSSKLYHVWSRVVSARNLALHHCEDGDGFRKWVCWAVSLMLERDSLRKHTRLSGYIKPALMSGRRRKSGPAKGVLASQRGRTRKAHTFDTDMGLPPERVEGRVADQNPDAPSPIRISPINKFIVQMSAEGFMTVLKMTATHVAIAWNAVSYPGGKQTLERTKFVRTDARMPPGGDPVITCAKCKPFAYSQAASGGPHGRVAGCVHTKVMQGVILAAKLIHRIKEAEVQKQINNNRFFLHVSQRYEKGREVVLISQSRDGKLVRNYLTPITEAAARSGECTEVAVCTIRCRGKETLLVCKDFRWSLNLSA